VGNEADQPLGFLVEVVAQHPLIDRQLEAVLLEGEGDQLRFMVMQNAIAIDPP
jgi:hypothetical protein